MSIAPPRPDVTWMTFDLCAALLNKKGTKMASAEAKKCWARFVSEYSDALCRLGEVLLAFASGVLTFVTFGTAYWELQGYGDSKNPQDFTENSHSGLWQRCTVLPNPDTSCKSIGLSGPGTHILSVNTTTVDP